MLCLFFLIINSVPTGISYSTGGVFLNILYIYYIIHCRKRTIFDDNPVEIQELTFIIKEDIANLNKQILQLQQVSPPLTLTGEKLSG